MVVYYFSGTGNSLVVARDIAEKTNAKLIPIASQLEKKIIIANADIIGIVFPVYYGDLPPIIRRFAEKLDNISNIFIFAVCTYGGGAGDSLSTLNQIIHSRGGELSAGYGVHMPQNAFSKPWENLERIYNKEKKKVEIISENSKMKKKGVFFSDIVSHAILFPFNILFKRLARRGLANLVHSSQHLSMEELIQEVDKSFSTNEKCTGCGICSEVCPVNNIQIIDKTLVWLHHCENCLACYNWCPHKAIQGEIAQKGYYYHHSNITSSDIANQRKNHEVELNVGSGLQSG
ncbi:MAG: 4Fe-4S binding protein [Theionarchaea archaeon]|nr:4Fe-4S binding protein [Theionarchaea archaeon]